MVLRIIAGLAVSVLAVAPQAHAVFGGGRVADSRARVSGNFNSSSGQNGTSSIDCSGPNCSSTITSGGSTGVAGTVTVATPEPLAALAAGLGLLGVRYLRRRRSCLPGPRAASPLRASVGREVADDDRQRRQAWNHGVRTPRTGHEAAGRHLDHAHAG